MVVAGLTSFGKIAKVDKGVKMTAKVAEMADTATKAAKIGTGQKINQSLTREMIIEQLDGVTNQSTKIAEGLRNGDIKLNVLGDELFDMYTGATDAKALQVGNQMYVRSSSQPIVSDIVHEGTHIIDYNNKFGMSGVSSWSWEKRAYYYERQFQINSGLKPDFNNLNDMQVHIWSNYKNQIYDPH